MHSDSHVLPRLGVVASHVLPALSLAYGIVLGIGLYTLPAPDQQIQQPWFELLELLILAISPAMVMLMVTLHAWAAQECKSAALLGIVFMSMCSTITCTVHFATLALSHQPFIAELAWSPFVFSFKWPSVAYVLDILAWDFFFPLAAIGAAMAVSGSGLAAAVRILLLSSAILALAGLVGVPLGNMYIRNIGVVGYAVLFPIAALLLLFLFRRSATH